MPSAGALVKTFAFSELAGAYLVSLVLFAIGAVVVFIGLRPDPREIGKEVALKFPAAGPAALEGRSVFQIFRQPAALVALLSIVLGQEAVWYCSAQ
jgi:hypothetical protein